MIKLYARATGDRYGPPRYLIDCQDGKPPVSVSALGQFANAIVRQRIGHNLFIILPL